MPGAHSKVDAFNTTQPTCLTVYRNRNKFDATADLVVIAAETGRPRTSMKEENEMRFAVAFVSSPKNTGRSVPLSLIHI